MYIELTCALSLSHNRLACLAQHPSLSASLYGTGESFHSFSVRLHKSANLLAKELFGTQLRQIRGISAGAAMSLIERYPSARSLSEAYAAQPNEEAEESMLEDMPRGQYQSVHGVHTTSRVAEN
jgi:hypothetical protein